MEMVSAEISSAIHQVILNGTALLAFSQIPNNPSPQNPNFPIPPEIVRTEQRFGHGGASIGASGRLIARTKPKLDLDHNVIELDAVQILAEHVHFCQICGKGFKRDANLRMHTDE